MCVVCVKCVRFAEERPQGLWSEAVQCVCAVLVTCCVGTVRGEEYAWSDMLWWCVACLSFCVVHGVCCVYAWLVACMVFAACACGVLCLQSVYMNHVYSSYT